MEIQIEDMIVERDRNLMGDTVNHLLANTHKSIKKKIVEPTKFYVSVILRI